MYLSENLNLLLRRKNIRKSDLARALNVSPQQITKYLYGDNQPKIEALIIMGELFDVAIDDLFLVNLGEAKGRPFGQGAADDGKDSDEQTKELNKLLRLRVAELERNIKGLDEQRAKELGIE